MPHPTLLLNKSLFLAQFCSFFHFSFLYGQAGHFDKLDSVLIYDTLIVLLFFSLFLEHCHNLILLLLDFCDEIR